MLNSEVYGQRPPITPEVGEKRLLYEAKIKMLYFLDLKEACSHYNINLDILKGAQNVTLVIPGDEKRLLFIDSILPCVLQGVQGQGVRK